MPHPCLVEITSISDGKIKGSEQMYGKDDAILVYGIDHSIRICTDRFSGTEPLDRLEHGPLTILKDIDASSPVLYQHLTSCTLLDEVALRYYTTDPDGVDVNFYTVILSNAIVTRITPESKTTLLSENEPYRHMESVSFSYKGIRWVDEINAKETSTSAYLLHDYGDEKKLMALGTLSAPIGAMGYYKYGGGCGTYGSVSRQSPIKTGIFDRNNKPVSFEKTPINSSMLSMGTLGVVTNGNLSDKSSVFNSSAWLKYDKNPKEAYGYVNNLSKDIDNIYNLNLKGPTAVEAKNLKVQVRDWLTPEDYKGIDYSKIDRAIDSISERELSKDEIKNIKDYVFKNEFLAPKDNMPKEVNDAYNGQVVKWLKMNDGECGSEEMIFIKHEFAEMTLKNEGGIEEIGNIAKRDKYLIHDDVHTAVEQIFDCTK